MLPDIQSRNMSPQRRHRLPQLLRIQTQPLTASVQYNACFAAGMYDALCARAAEGVVDAEGVGDGGRGGDVGEEGGED